MEGGEKRAEEPRWEVSFVELLVTRRWIQDAFPTPS
jgi:hypothetical protein